MKFAFKWPQVLAFRLTRHHLLNKKPANPVAVSRDVCGLQAQMPSAAELQLWARIDGLVRKEIHSALLENRTLVKTSCMRLALHLIPVAEFFVYINALKSSRIREMRRVMSYFGVTQKDADGVTEAVVDALSASPMTRRELTERSLSRKKTGKKARAWFEKSWWGVIRPAMVEGLVCYGPERDGEATYVRVDQWLKKPKSIPEGEAQQMLLRRYLSGYGPATLTDFRRWSGISGTELNKIWESLKKELVEVSIEGKKSFLLRRDYNHLAQSSFDAQSLQLLPHFDPYLLGHSKKDHLVSPARYKQVYRKAGWISPVVLLNGRVIGVWSYTRGAKRLSLKVEPFERFHKTIRPMIEEKAAGLGDFLGTSWEIKF
ncbi:MAG: winged helix DNA-binding domain-containing protein [candidate division Zixibacteria bacterium]|nr:winged helix DNA-binding domain-containing protein [candidate division Zixibacteria bacterium]